jgi:D-alanine-D-alanine ligase
MKKRSVCILFGGISPEHEVSLRSAESVLNNINREKYNVFPVGITKEGDWILFGGDDYSMLPSGQWLNHPANRRAAISPIRGQGLLTFEGDCVVREHIDIVFPILHGENGEDGAMQGLLQMAGIPYVGPHVSASAVAMDKTLTKLVVDNANITQAAWKLVRSTEAEERMDRVLDSLEKQFSYPMFVKPAGTGSSVGVSKASDREGLREALLAAGVYDQKILVEEFIHGREVEVAVMGNDSPVASICGEIDSGADFYDYDSKYVTDTSTAYIPARIPENVAEQVRDAAVKVYSAIGCQGLSRVDFFVTYEENRVVFNEINTLPGFTSISMYPKLFAASGIPYSELIDELLRLAMEACQ